MRDDDIDDTVVRRARAPRAADLADHVLGDTVIRPVPPDASASEDTLVRPTAAPRALHVPADDPAVSAPAPTTRVPSIRVGDRTLRLDRPVIVGRRPGLPRIVQGPTPELVTVPSPSGQVSSSHVLLHAEGEAAVVDDLRSTNGTVVRPAGAAPFRMPAGASNVVLTGTVVEIGDGNVIEILSPHLRIAPASGDLPPRPTWPADPPTGTPRTPRERP
ncbi:FHA domain-containing protein [Curtobacterium pusillum]|uniref:FHA domain-containing protein n=1 Tax=Curtobacterium pusillum TaxID=69373 RepID=UPI001643C802|nr:FHA domain-containing protein [Curtobacterium pusillum]